MTSSIFLNGLDVGNTLTTKYYIPPDNDKQMLSFKEFAYWLKGYFELSDHTGSLSSKQTQMIKKHLDLCFDNITSEPTLSSSQPAFTPFNFIPHHYLPSASHWYWTSGSNMNINDNPYPFPVFQPGIYYTNVPVCNGSGLSRRYC